MFAVQRQEARSYAVEAVTATPNNCFHPHTLRRVCSSTIHIYVDDAESTTLRGNSI